MFTYETHSPPQGRSHTELLRTGHIRRTLKHPPKKMFWVHFTSTGPGSLIPSEGMMISEELSDIKCRAIPSVEKNFPNSDGIFYQEHAPSHTSRRVKKVIEELKINILQ